MSPTTSQTGTSVTEPSLAATGETPAGVQQQAAGTHPAAPQGAPEQGRLQDVLPEIKDLAQRVGGLQQLARIIADLQQSKE
jgi:hypothetical protein